MKYMGSKRWMLSNGLGHLLNELAPHSKRFVDLFAGSAAVSHHVASNSSVPVVAFDLQKYSVVLARAVIGRCEKLEIDNIWKNWYERAKDIYEKQEFPKRKRFSRPYVDACRIWSEYKKAFPVTKAYGGHYFSPEQAIWIDALRSTLPKKNPERSVALAALIQAASQCAAAPGHTAQPFQPTKTAKKFLREAWNRNITENVLQALKDISEKFALKIGTAKVSDANISAANLKVGDLVFIDPPYSGVHYSRFYHVLETIARGKCGKVSGVGRYPVPKQRPRSKYSVMTESTPTFKNLLKKVSEKGARAIVTFPDHECSNGLSGETVRKIAKEFFSVEERVVKSKFSTLGGTKKGQKNGNGRAARQHAKELILILSPKESTGVNR
jgi:adenine-specific DNA-methyltransferase